MRKLALITLSAALAGCSGPPATSEGTTSTATMTAEPTEHVAVELNAQQQQGQVIFESVCWTCHGSAGHGDGPARTPEIMPPSFQTRDYALASQAVLMERFRASSGELDIDLDEVTQALEDEGVDKFIKPFDKLMGTLAEELRKAPA